VRVGIVGSSAEAWSESGAKRAQSAINELLVPGVVCVSGRSPKGGVDEWAEEMALCLGLKTDIHEPESPDWEHGYRPRNIKIATLSDVVHVFVPNAYPDGYVGRRHPSCYHCYDSGHVKSGGCWTARYARGIGKLAIWHVIDNA
jgi:hypothetical protein